MIELLGRPRRRKTFQPRLEVEYKPEVAHRGALSRFHDTGESLESDLIWLCGEGNREVLESLEE